MRQSGKARVVNTARTRLARSHPARGATLVELAIVLTVMALLAGMAVPSLHWITSARRNVAATQTRNALVYAQRWAVATQRTTWADFDVAQDRLSLFVEATSGGGPVLRQPLLDPLTRSAFVLELQDLGTGYDDVLMGADQSVQFDPDGAPSGGNGSAFSADGLVRMSGGARIRVVQQTGLLLVE